MAAQASVLTLYGSQTPFLRLELKPQLQHDCSESEPDIQAQPQNDPVLKSTAQCFPRMRSYRVAADST